MINPFLDENGQIQFKWKAVRDLVFIFPEPLPEEYNGFYIPEKFQNNFRTSTGIVLSCGPGYYDEKKRKWIPTTAKVGDYVIYDEGVLDTTWTVNVQGFDDLLHTVRYMGERDIQGVIRQ